MVLIEKEKKVHTPSKKDFKEKRRKQNAERLERFYKPYTDKLKKDRCKH